MRHSHWLSDPVRRYASIFKCGKSWDLQATIQTRRLPGLHLSLAATIKSPNKISITRCAAGCPATVPVLGCICRGVACTGTVRNKGYLLLLCADALPWPRRPRIPSLHAVTLVSTTVLTLLDYLLLGSGPPRYNANVAPTNAAMMGTASDFFGLG